MAVLHSPESAYAKEAWKWDHTIAETNPHDPGVRGVRPLGFQPYPARMYKAGRLANGQPGIIEACEVNSEAEQRNAENQGFVAGGQGAAMAKFEAMELEIAKLAANRAFNERRMSDKAQAEAAAFDDSTSAHVPVIPETPLKPRKKPGPKPKTDATE